MILMQVSTEYKALVLEGQGEATIRTEAWLDAAHIPWEDQAAAVTSCRANVQCCLSVSLPLPPQLCQSVTHLHSAL